MGVGGLDVEEVEGGVLRGVAAVLTDVEFHPPLVGGVLQALAVHLG